MVANITYLFSDPYFTGRSATDLAPGQFPVALGAHPYIIDLKKYRRRTLPALRPPQDNDPEPGENSLNTEGFWRRTQADWSLGAGQQFFDNSDSSRRRIVSSKGVDVWTRDALSLLHDTAVRNSSTDTNLKTLVVGGYLYFVEGATLAHTQDPSATSPTWTPVILTGVSATITGITTDGSFVYVADGTQIFKSTVGSATSTQLSTVDADGIWFGNGRLFASVANVLNEIAFAGTAAAAKTHQNTSFTWDSVIGAPNGIYAAGHSGDRSETYYIGIDATDGSLAEAIHAMPFPPSETVNVLANYGSLVLIGSSKGFRVASIDSANGLNHGPLVEVPGGVNDIDMQGQYAWFTWTGYDATSGGLGRINLAEFSAPLVPAYASDLMATTGNDILSVATFDDKQYFTVSAAGLYGQSANLVASGSALSGWVRFSTVERKVVSSIDLRHDALVGSISAQVISDDGTTVSTAASDSAGSLSPSAPLAVGMFDAEMFRVNVILTRDSTDTTTGPTLRRWTARAIATPFRSEEFIVPLIIKSKVSLGERRDVSMDPLQEFLFLKDLESARTVVRYQEGASTYNVYVDAIEVAPESWTDKRQFFNGEVIVRLITVESTS